MSKWGPKTEHNVIIHLWRGSIVHKWNTFTNGVLVPTISSYVRLWFNRKSTFLYDTRLHLRKSSDDTQRVLNRCPCLFHSSEILFNFVNIIYGTRFTTRITLECDIHRCCWSICCINDSFSTPKPEHIITHGLKSLVLFTVVISCSVWYFYNFHLNHIKFVIYVCAKLIKHYLESKKVDLWLCLTSHHHQITFIKTDSVLIELRIGITISIAVERPFHSRHLRPVEFTRRHSMVEYLKSLWFCSLWQ